MCRVDFSLVSCLPFIVVTFQREKIYRINDCFEVASFFAICRTHFLRNETFPRIEQRIISRLYTISLLFAVLMLCQASKD